MSCFVKIPSIFKVFGIFTKHEIWFQNSAHCTSSFIRTDRVLYEM